MLRLLIPVVAAIAVSLPLAQAAQAGPAAPSVPGEIAVTGDHKPYLIAHADGVQIYACYSVVDGYAWRLLAPRATLTDDNGKPLGRHYAGPTWEARDGSKVIGVRESGVSVDPTAIDWLRLRGDSTTAGPDGDRLTPTTYIQRINTVGGRPPAAGDCGADTVAEQREIPTAPTTSSSSRPAADPSRRGRVSEHLPATIAVHRIHSKEPNP